MRDLYRSLLRLIRWDKPTGSILLLGPTLAALWAAGRMAGAQQPVLWLVFTAGAITMRSLGCVINDLADRHWDGGVPRTADRPLVTGLVTAPQAWVCVSILACLALGIVWATNWLTILLSVPALLLALIYPYTKRWFGFPQWVLGCAYGFGVLLAYAAVVNRVPFQALWLFAAVVFWMVATDTIYALADLPYDKNLGIHSFARWLGRWSQVGVALCQVIFMICLGCWGYYSGVNVGFMVVWLLMLADCTYQHVLIRKKIDPIVVFKHNNYLSLMFLALSVVGLK